MNPILFKNVDLTTCYLLEDQPYETTIAKLEKELTLPQTPSLADFYQFSDNIHADFVALPKPQHSTLRGGMNCASNAEWLAALLTDSHTLLNQIFIAQTDDSVVMRPIRPSKDILPILTLLLEITKKLNLLPEELRTNFKSALKPLNLCSAQLPSVISASITKKSTLFLSPPSILNKNISIIQTLEKLEVVCRKNLVVGNLNLGKKKLFTILKNHLSSANSSPLISRFKQEFPGLNLPLNVQEKEFSLSFIQADGASIKELSYTAFRSHAFRQAPYVHYLNRLSQGTEIKLREEGLGNYIISNSLNHAIFTSIVPTWYPFQECTASIVLLGIFSFSPVTGLFSIGISAEEIKNLLESSQKQWVLQISNTQHAWAATIAPDTVHIWDSAKEEVETVTIENFWERSSSPELTYSLILPRESTEAILNDIKSYWGEVEKDLQSLIDENSLFISDEIKRISILFNSSFNPVPDLLFSSFSEWKKNTYFNLLSVPSLPTLSDSNMPLNRLLNHSITNFLFQNLSLVPEPSPLAGIWENYWELGQNIEMTNEESLPLLTLPLAFLNGLWDFNQKNLMVDSNLTSLDDLTDEHYQEIDDRVRENYKQIATRYAILDGGRRKVMKELENLLEHFCTSKTEEESIMFWEALLTHKLVDEQKKEMLIAGKAAFLSTLL